MTCLHQFVQYRKYLPTLHTHPLSHLPCFTIQLSAALGLAIYRSSTTTIIRHTIPHSFIPVGPATRCVHPLQGRA